MMSFVATLVVTADRTDEFEKLQTRLTELAIEHEPDLIAYHVLKQREAENTYVVYAAFKDQAAFDHHMGIDFHDELVPPILDCLAEEMDLKLFDGIAF
ncbi:MAG: antibiotic biosynthesis monooxygenase family protein [Pseudomonadota bacterium]|mgnify:CR=1 FL=1